jgi:PRC-barrel domain
MLNTKSTTKLACCLALALGTASVAAQQTSTAARRNPGDLDQIRKVSRLIGTDVMNHSNTKIGVLRDLAVSPEGAILYAVLSYGGVAGVGETYTAAPFDLMGVRHDSGKWAVKLDMTTDVLKKAPTMHSENCRELGDAQWIARLDEFFKAQGQSPNHGDRKVEPGQRERRTVERTLLATKIRAARLKNSQNEELGNIEDLLLNGMHHVVFVIVGRGGVLGVGENFIPIPWSKLGLSANRENGTVMASIDTSKADFEKAPLVKGDNYTTLLAPGFAEEVRHYFGVTASTSGKE